MLSFNHCFKVLCIISEALGQILTLSHPRPLCACLATRPCLHPSTLITRTLASYCAHDVCRYLGSGGMGGLVSMILQDSEKLSMGLRAAYAEGNAMGKGPVVMRVPRCRGMVVRQF